MTACFRDPIRIHSHEWAQTLSVTNICTFLIWTLEGQGEFINEENPFLIGAVTGAVSVRCMNVMNARLSMRGDSWPGLNGLNFA